METMTDEELAYELRERFELPISSSDINRCDVDTVQKIYVCFLRDLGVSLEMNEVSAVSGHMQKYQDMYRTTFRMMQLANIIKRFIYDFFGDDSFTPADFIDPSAKRTKHFLIKMLSIFDLFKNNMEQYDEINRRVEMKFENVQKMREKKEKWGHALKLEREKVKIQLEEQEKRTALEREKVEEYHTKTVHLKKKKDTLKLKLASLDNAIKEAKGEVIQKSEHLTELKSQVLLDGEKEKIQERDDQLAQLKEDLQQKKMCLAHLESTLTMQEKDQETMDTLVKMMNDILLEINKERKILEKVKELEQSKNVMQEEIEDKKSQIEQYKQKIESVKTKFSQMCNTWNTHRQSIIEENKQSKITLEECRRRKTENEIVSNDLEKEHTHIILEIDQFKEQIIILNNYIAEIYKKNVEAMKSVNTTLEESLEGLRQAINSIKSETD